MKEATGELSGTVITVVAIAAVAAIFTALVLPAIRGSIRARLHCADAVNCRDCADGKCTCDYYNEEGTAIAGNITCDDPSTVGA